MAASDGSIVFKTDLDNSDLEKQLKNTEKSIDSLKKKIEGQQIERTVAEREIERLEQQIGNTKERIGELNQEIAGLGNSGLGEIEQIQRHRELLVQINEQYAQISKYRDKQDALDNTWNKANDKIFAYTQHLTAAQNRQRALSTEYARSFNSVGTSVSNAMARAKAAMAGFALRMGSMLKQALVFSVIYKALGALKTGIANALKQNVQFSASWESLKATVNGFAIGVANVVAPVISSVVGFATKMITNLARLIDMVFGTRIQQAIAGARQAAEQEWRKTPESEQAEKDEQQRQKNLEKAEEAARKAADADKDQAKAAKNLAKEQKKANAQILSFDELNKLAEESSEDVEDAMDDYADALADSINSDGIDPSLYEAIDPGEYLQPNWDALDVGKIDAKLAEIMAILGASLMAVGAILAFSGINIPLGLTLMVIGALMVYTAYQEMWDKLPQETRDAISGAIAITGAVLIVLGAVIAFSGVNLALGIGMMAAGAIMLYTAAALNWQFMSTEVQMVITTILVVLSTALLVIGAVLAFSGANLPLGIGLMVAGAASLAAAAALNWDYLQENFDRIVPAIEAVLGMALLVVGAVLAFSGAATPLGIGLMALGAVSLGKSATEDWDKVPNEVRAVLGKLELVLGPALLVIGAVLTFSTANIPLGLALLAAGAISLARALFVDWDKIPNEIRTTVATIEAIVAPALLVLGAVLTFTGNLPLGIALLAAGAMALVHLATLDWNAMPAGVRNAVTTILGIIGGALIVIGIILCVTGVGIPLGIALIAAGAASLIAAAAINWDFIVDKVKEIWKKIKNFWNTNIAPVFTWRWWANVFKSMVNGLIQMINNGLNAFGGFLNNLASGVSSILNFFGVKGWSFRIGMPQIPYLAQGAVIPPNREFMAVLGDQRSGNNIETPESLMRQVVREESGALLADALASLLGGDGRGAQDVVLMVGRKELARETLRGVRELQDTGELGTSGLIFA